MPTGRPDGVFEPLICGVAEQLMATGLPQQTLKEAFLIYMAINSARLGHPLSALLLPDDPMAAVSLLDRVKNPLKSVLKMPTKPFYKYLSVMFASF